MKKVRITVMKKAEYIDLMERYENPMGSPCDLREGMVFISEEWRKPEKFCDSAWGSISPFVLALACGGEGIYGDWMKDKKSAMISCNDGFRPVSFLLETIETDG